MVCWEIIQFQNLNRSTQQKIYKCHVHIPIYLTFLSSYHIYTQTFSHIPAIWNLVLISDSILLRFKSLLFLLPWLYHRNDSIGIGHSNSGSTINIGTILRKCDGNMYISLQAGGQNSNLILFNIWKIYLKWLPSFSSIQFITRVLSKNICFYICFI